VALVAVDETAAVAEYSPPAEIDRLFKANELFLIVAIPKDAPDVPVVLLFKTTPVDVFAMTSALGMRFPVFASLTVTATELTDVVPSLLVSVNAPDPITLFTTIKYVPDDEGV
jgi:hypothetical protein